MELKPTPEDLAEIEDGIAIEQEENQLLEKQRQEREERDAQIDRLSSVLNNLEKLDRLQIKEDDTGKVDDKFWVDIKSDEESGTKLQATVIHNYTPYTELSDYIMQERRSRTVYTRFVDNMGHATSRNLVLIWHQEKGFNAFRIAQTHGLEGGDVSLIGNQIVDPAVIDQILEINTELINPIVRQLQP